MYSLSLSISADLSSSRPGLPDQPLYPNGNSVKVFLRGTVSWNGNIMRYAARTAVKAETMRSLLFIMTLGCLVFFGPSAARASNSISARFPQYDSGQHKHHDHYSEYDEAPAPREKSHRRR